MSQDEDDNDVGSKGRKEGILNPRSVGIKKRIKTGKLIPQTSQQIIIWNIEKAHFKKQVISPVIAKIK